MKWYALGINVLSFNRDRFIEIRLKSSCWIYFLSRKKYDKLVRANSEYRTEAIFRILQGVLPSSLETSLLNNTVQSI